MKCKWLRRWLHWVHRSVMSQLNGQLSRPAEGGDGHGRDGARPAAGAARERERRGGRRRRRRGDGGQDGGLAGGPRVPLVGVGRRRRRSADRSGPRVTTVQQMLTFTLRNINRLFFPAHWQRKKKRKKKCPRHPLSSCLKCFQHPSLLVSGGPVGMWPQSVSKSAGTAVVELTRRQ